MSRTAPRPRLRAALTDPRLPPLLGHPRVAVALKAALAAALAWGIANSLPAPAATYAYYAPMGSVIAMYPAVASSVRASLRGVLGIILGAVIAFACDAAFGTGPVTVAVAVAVGILVGGLRWLGEQRTWVPLAALFVLVIGSSETSSMAFAASYSGLVLLGGLIAIAVNALLPSVPIGPASRSTAQLREALATELDRVARTVEEEAGTAHEGPDASPSLQALLSQMRESVQQAAEAARGNHRVRRRQAALDEEYALARELERVALLVEDLALLVQEDPWEREGRVLNADVRAPLARALRALAEVLRSVGSGGADAGRSVAAERAIVELAEALGPLGTGGRLTPDQLQAATVVTTLQRCLAAVAPPGTVTFPSR